MYLHFILLHGLVHMSAFCIFCRLVVIQVFTRSFLRREFWSYIEFPLKQKVFFFFSGIKNYFATEHNGLCSDCYWTNTYFKLFIWLLVKSCRLLANMKIIQTECDEFFSRSKWTIAELKQEREFYCSICMWREMMKDSDLLLQIFFPHSSRKFQSFRVGLIYFSFSFQSFVQKNQHSGLRKYKYLPNVGW